MNNEPVAWMVTSKVICLEPIEGAIPLYTHPAKTEDEGKVCARCGAIAYDPVITYPAKPTKVKFASNSCESGWIYLDYEEPAKTLTDEEIEKLATSKMNQILMDLLMPDVGHAGRIDWNMGCTKQHLMDFARAILRKAQEK